MKLFFVTKTIFFTLAATSTLPNNCVDGFSNSVARSYEVGPPPTKGGVWVKDATSTEIRNLVGKSFAGTSETTGEPICDWIKDHLNKQEWYSEDQHQNTVHFALGIAIDDVYKQNPLVISKCDDNGELVSAAIVTEYDKEIESSFRRKLVKEWREWKSFAKLAVTEGLPDIFAKREYKRDANHLKKKMDISMSALSRWHSKYGPNEKHWYVNMVGVGPQFKGMGYGGELMSKISSLADEAGMMCYLECGASNLKFYEKMGYNILSKHVLADPEDTSREPCVAYVLTRDPQV